MTGSQFSLGVERPAFAEGEGVGTVNGPTALLDRSVQHQQQQQRPLHNDRKPASDQVKMQWCVQAATDDGNFSNTTSDADDLLF